MKTKKLFVIASIIFALFLGLGISANAATYSGSCGDNLTWKLDTSTGIFTISGSGKMGGDYYGSPPWYSYKSSIKTLIIENGVTSIKSYSFEDCDNLTSVTIPNSVSSIESNAFEYCTSLTSITIPDSVTTIGDYTFYGCSSLKNITISNNITALGSWIFGKTAYYNDTTNWSNNALYIGDYLVEVKETVSGNYNIKDGTKIISNNAFRECSSLTDITIPNSITSIGSSAFEDCSGLVNITIPDSVTTIGSRAFACCSSLTSITIPDSITAISAGTFYQCGSLVSVTIPEGVTSIGNGAFSSCYRLTTIILPDGITTIDHYAFDGCSSLTSITIPDSVTSIGEQAFDSCSSLTSITIPDGVTSIGLATFSYCKGLESITIPNSVTEIGGSVFEYCTSLSSITIPNSVTSIGSYAFRRCDSLKNIYYIGSKTEWKKITKGDYNTALSSATIHYMKDCSFTIISPEGDIETDADGNTIKISVPNSVSSVTFDLTVSDGAKWNMYRQNDYTIENTTKTINGLVAGSTPRTVYIRVTAADGNTTKDYAIAVYRKTKATDPVITINGSKVTITAASGNIYYTTDGSDPTESSNKYTGEFTGLSNAVIKAIVIDSTKDEWSNIVTETVPTYITTTLEADYVTADSSSNSLYFGFVISSDGEPTGTFIVAAYDDSERLISCKTIDITAATDYVEDSFTYSGTPHTYKAFFWDSLDNLVPLCECIGGNVE